MEEWSHHDDRSLAVLPWHSAACRFGSECSAVMYYQLVMILEISGLLEHYTDRGQMWSVQTTLFRPLMQVCRCNKLAFWYWGFIIINNAVARLLFARLHNTVAK